MNFFYLKMFWTFENVWRLKMHSFFLHDHEFIGKPIAVNTEVPNLVQYVYIFFELYRIPEPYFLFRFSEIFLTPMKVAIELFAATTAK